MLKTMLKGRGIHVNKLQLEKFLLFIKEVCLQSPSAVILEPRKVKSDTVSTVSPSTSHEVMGPDA